MLKIDNESLTDKTTVIWENESGIMSTFTLKIESIMIIAAGINVTTLRLK